MNVIMAGLSVWSPKDTKIITYIYTSFYHIFLKKYSNIFICIFSKCQFKPPPDLFRRWTGPPIHANQNNHITTKNIVLVLCFVTVLCHIVNRSYMLNTVQHSYMIKVFISINKRRRNQTVPKYSIKHSCV